MKAILKYAKKFLPLIVCMIFFIAVQALADLRLPRFTSDIVNIGIQQGGITESLPTHIRADEAQRFMLLLDADDALLMQASYIEQNEKYILKEDITDPQKAELRAAMQVPQAFLYSLYSAAGSEETVLELPEALGDAAALNELWQKGDEKSLQAALPLILRAVEDFAASADESLEQSAIAYVQQELVACGEDIHAIRNAYMLKTGSQMLAFALLIVVSAVCANFCTTRLGAGFARELRSGVFRRVMHFSQKEFTGMSTATLITRSTNDIQQIQMLFTMSLRLMFFAPIMGFGSLVNVIDMNVGMTWVVAFAVFAILTLMISLLCITMPKFKLMQRLIDRINQVAREALSGLPVVRAFSREEYENKRFDEANTNLLKTSLYLNRLMSIQHPVQTLIMNGISVLIIWIGADLINNGAAQVGDLLAFIQYAMHIVISFSFVSMLSIQLPRAIVSIKRVGEILEMPISITDPAEPMSFSQEQKGVVEFRNVCFRYPNAEADVLQNISFVARPGETTAFIGSTGSGKSTLITLIPRFFDVTSGEILVNGMDIRKVKLSELRSKIGFVPQKGQLFSGTIASNIAYGIDELDEATMRKAAEVAQAAAFIEADPNGYERAIAQGGTNVSGGQRQRLSIARAIAKNPEIYIFDDSFSALDFKTDAALRKALFQHTADATVLIVAQRISTVLRADQIIVLDKGRIVGKGTHAELLASCDVYRQIAESQLSKEELN